MSVKHLEYLKINNSKVLMVEVRPVKCLLDTPSGPTHTDKWMECSHWKELYHLMTDIVEEYEEQKIAQGIKCNQPKCKTGATIQMGYMFRGLPSCWCSLYFLTPRNSFSWTKNDDDRELQDKGGRFEDFALCGEMLVISVILRDSSLSSTTETAPTPSSSGTFQQACLNHKLIKALDNRATYVNSISDYFKASTASTDDSSAKCVPSSNGGRHRSPPLRVKTSTSCNAEQESKGDESSESSEAIKVIDSSDCDSSLNPLSFSLKEVNSETDEREMDLQCSYNSEHAIFNETKSFLNCVEFTKNNFTMISYKDNNLENNIERPMGPAYQCCDINSDGMYNNFVLLTSESEEMFSNLESPNYQLDTLNDSNISCSVSVYPCNPLRDHSQIGNVSLGPQTDSCTATDTVDEADETSNFHSVVGDSTLFDVVIGENIGKSEDNCVSHEMDSWKSRILPTSNCDENEQKVRSWEVDKADESILNGNEPELKMEGQGDILPHKIHSDYLPGTNTSERKNHRKNSPSLEAESVSTSEDNVIDAENSIRCAQMSEDLSVSVKSKDHVPERKLPQVEAVKDNVFSATPVKTFHAENVLEEDLHCCSDPAEKYVGQKMPSTRCATQECLPPQRLLTPATDSALSIHATRESGSTDESSLSTQNCGHFNFVGSDMQSLQQTPRHEYQGAVQLSSKNIVKEVHSSRKTHRTIESMKIAEQKILDKEQHENFDIPEAQCKCHIEYVEKKSGVHRNLTKALKVSDPEDENKWMRMSCNSIFAVSGENSAREDFLPTIKEELHPDSESHQFNCQLLCDSSALSSSCQNLCGAILDSAGEVGKQSSAQSGMDNHSVGCPNSEETADLFGYVDKPEMKLEPQGNAPYISDSEYVDPGITCKWKKKSKKSKRNMPDYELEYDPTSLRNLSPTNYESCTVEDSVVQEGDCARSVGAPEAEPVGNTNELEMKLKFQNNAPLRVDKEYVPEKIACNWKKEKGKNIPYHKLEYIPANIRHLSVTNLTHGTHVSEDLPLCVEKGNYLPKRTQQQIQATETCVPLFICEEKRDAGNAFEEDLDLLSVSTEEYDSPKIPDTMETPQQCVPPQRLVSHLIEESYNKINYPKSCLSCVQSSKLNKEPLKRSTVFDGQEATYERMKKNHPLKQSLRSFGNCESSKGKYEDETCIKRRDIRSKKDYCNTGKIKKRNTHTDQKEKLQKEVITSHTSASGTAMKSNLCFNENMIGESVLSDNSFDSMSSQNAGILSNTSPDQVDAYKGSVQPENLGHELGSSSLQSSLCAFHKQDKAQNAHYDVIQCTKGRKVDPGARHDETDAKNILTSNCKNCVQQKTPCRCNRKVQLPVGINTPKMQVTEDDTTDQECVPKGVMPPERKRKSVPTNEKHHTLANKKKSAEKRVTQVEESDPSGQDTVREHMFGESSQNCSPTNIYRSIRLPEEYASELQSGEHEKESSLRRSNRLKGKIPNISWLLDFSDEDLPEEHIREKGDIAAETEKSIKFFEKYVKERNANKSVLKQKKILDQVKPYNTLEQENDCEEWSFKSTDKKRSPVNTKRKLSRSVKPKNTKNKATKKLHGQDSNPQELLKPTSKLDTSERPKFNVEQAALICHKEICDFTFHDEQREKRAKNNNKSMKESGEKSVSQERKKVSSPQKVVRKRVRKKKTLISGTSTVDDSEGDLENHATASEKDALHWILLAEMEEHDPLVSDADTVLESSQNSHGSPRTEEESSKSGDKEEQLQPTEKEDEVDVVYSQNLASLKASYRRLQSMTESDLEQRLDENLSYLERVVLGRVPNERHEMFVSSLQQLKQQQDYLLCGPFTADQTEHVLELLKKKLSHLDSLFRNVYDLLTYRCRVLMPTFLTKIVMDNENVSLKQAEQLMIKLSLDQNITGTTNTRD